MKDTDRKILQKIVEEIDYLDVLLEGMSLHEFIESETIRRAAAITSKQSDAPLQ